MLYRALRSLLFLLPAEAAHRLALACLRWLGRRPRLRAGLRARLAPGLPELGCSRFGLTFDNPIGLAAGFDKEAEATAGLFALGFGFVEVGTLTPLPQDGNPKPRLFRVPRDRALVNRMGFNNPGVEAALKQLQAPGGYRPGPLGVNLGKNKVTPEERAAADYQAGLKALAPVADYLVVNVSSPNTPGLRRLQDADRLVPLLLGLREANTLRRPLLLKFAPDLEDAALEELVDCAVSAGVDGLIATNTTLARPDPPWGAYREAGGVSGAPLATRATRCLQLARRRAPGLPVVASGGLFTGDDVFERLKLGACLVQLYTGFIYGGPGVVGRLCRELAGRMRREGYRSLDELTGK
jgi:dihydroorotate dehydrogenase